MVVEAALIFEGQVSEAPNGDVDEWVAVMKGVLEKAKKTGTNVSGEEAKL